MPVSEEEALKARMNHPVTIIPEAMQALLALGASSKTAGVSAQTLDLVNLRASQINGCSVCVDMHARDLKKAGETDCRIFAVAAWRDNASFTAAERAALALTEAVTRIADSSDPVPDDVWANAAKHYNEKALAGLLLAIANINAWNRLNAAIRQVVGESNG